jgi:hypothetical protein
MIALAFVFAAANGPVMAPTITSSLEPQVAEVGDPLLYVLKIEHAQADEVQLPQEIDWGGLELLDKQRTSSAKGPVITEELHFKLASYEVGEHAVPPIGLVIAGVPFTTAELKVTTQSVMESPPEAKAGDQPVPPQAGNPASQPAQARKEDGPPLSIEETRYWPLIALAALLLGAAAYLLWKRRQARQPVEIAPELRIPAHQAALQLLKLLRQKDYLRYGNFRDYYFEASEIVRGYLSQRYAINALDLTTRELGLKLSAISAPGLDRAGLEKWLDHADLVKFAKSMPDTSEAAAMVDFFESLVWNTRPPEPKSVRTSEAA